ncbi:histidine kinase [Dyadobacter sp. CY261]|uniref:sensor histidine kinase n=1 Tax=Dyadobacter sp. CY261 TaxID=2907203 RepID=UPI001F295FA5|nr:7TM diverse intracellular signaling domain-containing protein [Dyadobacter sp. CY261]MCF0072286.1 histidine kinase [Dyadobacter sp. CY261]
MGQTTELPVIELDYRQSNYSVGRNMLMLEDPTNALQLSNVEGKPELFRPMTQEILNVGPSASTFWLKLRVVSKMQQEWFLHVRAPFLKQVDLFTETRPSYDQIEMHITNVGSALPYHDRPVLTNQTILPLNLIRKDTATIYLRVRSNSIIRVPLEISTLQHIYENSQENDIAHGFYFGLIAALIIYNLFVFISIRERSYLYYVFYIFCVAMNISYIKGHFLQFMVPHFPQANHSNYSGSLAFIFALLFTNSFLNTSYYCPRLKKLGWLIVVSCVAIIVLSLSGYLLLGFQLNWLTVGFFLIYSNLIGFAVLRQGFKPAKYYLMAFTALLAGILIFMMKDMAVIPENWFTEGSYQIGSGLEAIILSFALANKLNTYKREKEVTQAEALAQAKLFSQQLIGSQESERKRVAAELHDSLGQSLGMVKNKVLMIKRDTEKPQLREKQLRDLEEMVTDAIQEVRNISYNLRPLHLELLGITQSLHSLLEDVVETGLIGLETDIQNFDNLLTKTNEMNVFRIVQECFNNILKHAQANAARIQISKKDTMIAIRIEDNGVGIGPVATEKGGFGMIGIRERLNILNGQIEILENKPSGTIINIQIPF